MRPSTTPQHADNTQLLDVTWQGATSKDGGECSHLRGLLPDFSYLADLLMYVSVVGCTYVWS